jgi:hypothetical protein
MHTQEIDIATPDGAMSAYEIVPADEGPRPAIVFLMDGLGYRAGLKTMAERLASHGYHVLLPDLYHRVGRHVHFEPTVMTQPEKMGEMRNLIGGLTPDMLTSDVATCLDVLGARANVDATRVGAVGYCMGAAVRGGRVQRLGVRVAFDGLERVTGEQRPMQRRLGGLELAPVGEHHCVPILVLRPRPALLHQRGEGSLGGVEVPALEL